MPKRPLTVGTQTFSSMQDATAYVKQILSRPDYDNNAKLREEDDLFIRDLLSLHPNAEDKIGIGIGHIEVRKNPTHPTTRCFFVVRIDNSMTEFSYAKCIAQKTTHLSNLKRAFRDSVAEDVSAIREHFIKSDEGRDLIARGELIHIDHFDPTFDCLIGKFIEQRRDIDWEEVEFDGLGVDNSSTVSFHDHKLGEQFKAFHRKYANLRPVTRTDNLSRYKSGVRKQVIAENIFVYAQPEDWSRTFPID